MGTKRTYGNLNKRIGLGKYIKNKNTYTQNEILQLINEYNNTDRQVIKNNLRRILNKKKFKAKDIIIDLNFSSPNVYSWFAPTAPNIPMFDQSLFIACQYDFDVKELFK